MKSQMQMMKRNWQNGRAKPSDEVEVLTNKPTDNVSPNGSSTSTHMYCIQN